MAAEVAGAVIVVLLLTTFVVRRRRHTRDSVEVFSAATKALRRITQELAASRDPAEIEAARARHPSTMPVVSDTAVIDLELARRSRTRDAHGRRPDDDALARRPVVASLPTTPVRSPRPTGSGQQAG